MWLEDPKEPVGEELSLAALTYPGLRKESALAQLHLLFPWEERKMVKNIQISIDKPILPFFFFFFSLFHAIKVK